MKLHGGAAKKVGPRETVDFRAAPVVDLLALSNLSLLQRSSTFTASGIFSNTIKSSNLQKHAGTLVVTPKVLAVVAKERDFACRSCVTSSFCSAVLLLAAFLE